MGSAGLCDVGSVDAVADAEAEAGVSEVSAVAYAE